MSPAVPSAALRAALALVSLTAPLVPKRQRTRWRELLAQLVIHNGIAVAFPAWVRLRPGGGAGGVEMMGQMMVTFYGGLFALMVALIVPAGAAAAAWFLVAGSWAVPLLPDVVFAACLFVECAAETELFGRILDRADLQDVAIVE